MKRQGEGRNECEVDKKEENKEKWDGNEEREE